jgi:hypothetical protein
MTVERGGVRVPEPVAAGLGQQATTPHGAPSHARIEDEIRRLENASGFADSPVSWDKVVAIRRVLRWVLGLDPQSPFERITDPAPSRLHDVTRKDGT